MRTRTNPATIRAALDTADQHGVYVAARQLNLDHRTIYRWVKKRDRISPDWPTRADIDAWEADEAANSADRRRRAANQARRRKHAYLTGQPILKPAIGSIRRIQALYALGWTCVDIGNEIGASKETVARIMRGRFKTLTPKTVKRIEDAYARLSMVVPADAPTGARGYSKVHQRARRDAKRRGYVPPLAWDDDSIDDPTASPHDITPPKKTAGGQGRPVEDVVEDVEFLLRHHPYATSIDIAERLGYRDQTGVQNALRRANRIDLTAALNRNAELAGLNVTRRTA